MELCRSHEAQLERRLLQAFKARQTASKAFLVNDVETANRLLGCLLAAAAAQGSGDGIRNLMSQIDVPMLTKEVATSQGKLTGKDRMRAFCGLSKDGARSICVVVVVVVVCILQIVLYRMGVGGGGADDDGGGAEVEICIL